MRTRSPLAAALFAGFLLLPAALRADDDSSKDWIGVKVMPKSGWTMKVGDRVVADDKHSGPNSIPWVVQKVDGGWFWVGDVDPGWVQWEDVVVLDDAPAYYTGLIRQDAGDSWAYDKRATAWRVKGEIDNAIKDYSECIRIDAADASRLAADYNNRGNAWLNKPDYDRAIQDYDEAIRNDPNSAFAYNNRGESWREKGDYDKAIKDYDEAIRLIANCSQVFDGRGRAHLLNKQYDEAIHDYGEAVRVDPKSPWGYRGHAWFLACCPDGSRRDGMRAVEMATKACELSGYRDGGCLDTLAAAQAEKGDFAAAARWEEKAIRLTRSPVDLAECRERLALFKDHKPFRDEPKTAAKPAEAR